MITPISGKHKSEWVRWKRIISYENMHLLLTYPEYTYIVYVYSYVKVSKNTALLRAYCHKTAIKTVISVYILFLIIGTWIKLLLIYKSEKIEVKKAFCNS